MTAGGIRQYVNRSMSRAAEKLHTPVQGKSDVKNNIRNDNNNDNSYTNDDNNDDYHNDNYHNDNYYNSNNDNIHKIIAINRNSHR